MIIFISPTSVYILSGNTYKSFVLWVRYFVADTVLEEVTFGWPRQRGSFQLKEHLALGLERAIDWVPCFYEFKQRVLY